MSEVIISFMRGIDNHLTPGTIVNDETRTDIKATVKASIKKHHAAFSKQMATKVHPILTEVAEKKHLSPVPKVEFVFFGTVHQDGTYDVNAIPSLVTPANLDFPAWEEHVLMRHLFEETLLARLGDEAWQDDTDDWVESPL